MGEARFVDVTDEAAEAGFCCRVLMTEQVWNLCCQWTEQDTARQGFQEQDARIWDVFFVPATKLRMGIAGGYAENELLAPFGLRYQIYCLLRGENKEASLITLRMLPATFKEGTHGLIVSFPDDPL
ncbi:MAG: hypothetical protein VB050_04865 [Geobacteraceae bacterium]|nr:hypothetical protein [Geobacteraceae bacterium]